MINNKYYLVINPYIFINKKGNSILFYNTKTKKAVDFKINIFNKHIFQEICIPANMNVVIIDLNDLNKNNKIVRKLIAGHYAILTAVENDKNKPIHFPANLFLKSDVERDGIMPSDNFNIFERVNNISKYITDLYIYINNHTDKKYSQISKIAPSFLYNEYYEELKSEDIQLVIEQLKHTKLRNVNVLGGNIYRHPEINKIIEYISELNYLVVLHVEIDEIINQSINEKFLYYIHIIVDENIIEKNKICFFELFANKKNINFIFYVDDNNVIEKTYYLIENYNIINYLIYPILNKKKSFIKKCLFQTKKEILESEMTLQDIYLNEKINKNNFGNVLISNNGNIYTNLNYESIGNINFDNILQNITQEFKEKKSWLNTRKKNEPCSNCSLNILCPPISNYELLLNQNNLCYLKKY